MNSSCSACIFSSEFQYFFSIDIVSGGFEKYSLAIQFIFSSLDNFENPVTVLFILEYLGIISCKDTFLVLLFAVSKLANHSIVSLSKWNINYILSSIEFII